MDFYKKSIQFLIQNHKFYTMRREYDIFNQDILEWNLFCNYVHNNYKINFGLEIGSFCGGTLYSLCQIAEDDATIISIDNFTYMNNDIFKNIEIRNELFNKFKKPNQKLHIISKDSKSLETKKELSTILGDNKLDYFLIDGDHSYEGVKNDFEEYMKFMNTNKSIIGLHDYVTDSRVTKYINELINNKYKIRRLSSPNSNLVYLEI